MPGMMDTILNLGLNDKTVIALKNRTSNGRFAKDSYRRFIQMYGTVALGIHSHLFEHIYSPVEFLELIKGILKEDGYHIFSIPNLNQMIINTQSNAMNFEHPYFLEENLIDQILKSLGFEILVKKFSSTSNSSHNSNEVRNANYYKSKLG